MFSVAALVICLIIRFCFPKGKSIARIIKLLISRCMRCITQISRLSELESNVNGFWQQVCQLSSKPHSHTKRVRNSLPFNTQEDTGVTFH